MPAAAVIPAPIAYIKVVAVKKLVVEFLSPPMRPLRCDAPAAASLPARGPFTGRRAAGDVYCEKIRVFNAGLWLEYISME